MGLWGPEISRLLIMFTPQDVCVNTLTVKQQPVESVKPKTKMTIGLN